MKKIISRLIVACIAIGTLTISMAALTIGWFVGPAGKTKDEGLDGKVGLRSYFYKGDGSAANPYEIVTPTHMYNLSLLQNLGVFPKKMWFRVGHDFGNGLKCMNGRTGDRTYEDYLDMSQLPEGVRFYPVGSEGTPFYGDFDGQGVPIKKMKVYGNPDDIGVFGYVSSTGSVKGLVCHNLEVHSLGYTSQTSEPEYTLYHSDITKLFNDSADAFMNATNLNFYLAPEQVGNAWVPVKENGLRGANGSGTTITNLDLPANIKTVTEVDQSTQQNTVSNLLYNKGYFKPTFPTKTNAAPFTYSWESSSPLIKKVALKDIAGGSSEEEVMAFDLKSISVIPEHPESTEAADDFNNGQKNMEIDARISLTASYHDEVENLTYSRVIQTYKIEFKSNRGQYGGGQFSADIFCDYMNRNITGDHFTNYVHGNNIGFLAGHVDGTMLDCYLYKGEFYFNAESNNGIVTESDIGLIGEVGTNVANGAEGKIGKTEHGDTGIMNFTKIYGKIRDDMKAGVQVYAGHVNSGDISYISYQNYLKDGFNESRGDVLENQLDAQGNIVRDDDGNPILEAIEYRRNGDAVIAKINHGSTNTFDDFKQFLRLSHTVNGRQEYITKTSSSMYSLSQDGWHTYTPGTISEGSDFNSVDFLWNKIIEDEKDANGNFIKDRGLGVFKITTVENTTVANLIKNNPSEYEAHYLDNIGATTIQNGVAKTDVFFSTAEYDYTKNNGSHTSFNPLRATSIPSYPSDGDILDTHTFDYPFSRDYNYVFKLDLTEMPLLGDNNYMWNTDSPFLTTYLNTVLIDKYGVPITKSNSNGNFYGFKFMSSEGELLDKLSSYMPLGVPGATVRFDDDGDGQADRAFPSNCIVFKIDNTAGANVSVVGNHGDIAIYGIDYDENDSLSCSTHMMYKMKSSNVTGTDSHRYFTYTADSTAQQNTTTITQKNSVNGDNGALYAHIFHLTQAGYYAIGAPSGARLYFLAVQGQEDATIGVKENMAQVGDAKAEVDFLLNESTISDYVNRALEQNPLGKSYLQFKAVYDTTAGAHFKVSVTKDRRNNDCIYLVWSGSFLLSLKIHSINGNTYRVNKHNGEGNDEEYSYIEYPYPLNSGG